MAIANTTNVILVGRLYADDVNARKFQLRLDDGLVVPLKVDDQNREDIKAVVRNHESIKAKVSGLAELNEQGVPVRVVDVESIDYESDQHTTADDLLKMVQEVFKGVPEEEWDQLPKDGARNHDHYIYGTRKRYP
jgi:hypothetical protein